MGGGGGRGGDPALPAFGRAGNPTAACGGGEVTAEQVAARLAGPGLSVELQARRAWLAAVRPGHLGWRGGTAGGEGRWREREPRRPQRRRRRGGRRWLRLRDLTARGEAGALSPASAAATRGEKARTKGAEGRTVCLPVAPRAPLRDGDRHSRPPPRWLRGSTGSAGSRASGRRDFQCHGNRGFGAAFGARPLRPGLRGASAAAAGALDPLKTVLPPETHRGN